MSPAHSLVSHALSVGAIRLLKRKSTPDKSCPYVVHAQRLLARTDSAPFLASAYATHAKIPGAILLGTGRRSGQIAEQVAHTALDAYAVSIGYAVRMGDAVTCVDAQGVHHEHLRGMPVLLMVDDDFRCSGLLSSVDCIEAHGGILLGILPLFDRQECIGSPSRSTLSELWSDYFGVPVHAAATLHDLVEVLSNDQGTRYPLGPSVLHAIRARLETRIRW